MLRAVIFDFDGLILETELPEYQAWEEIFQAYRCHFPLEDWIAWVGGAPDLGRLLGLLEARSGQAVDREGIRARHLRRFQELVDTQPLLPGVIDTIDKARQLGLRLGVASSSPRWWVAGHLSRLGLIQCFDVVLTKDEVSRVKPAPDLYLAAVEALGVQPGEALALEDSPNGLVAAREAGLDCIIVPSPLTRQGRFEGAAMKLESLEEFRLEEYVKARDKG